MKLGEMIERCPYCAELLVIPSPEEGGPFAGELIRCSTCGRTFVLELDDMIQNHAHHGSGFGAVLKRLFFGFGAMVTNFTSALLMVLVILFWAFMMFLLGWMFGDEVFGLLGGIFK